MTLISKSDGWWKVEYEKGKFGYCHGDYITVAGGTQSTVATQSGALNVRSGAGTTYGVKTFSQFTANARAQIKKLNGGSACNGYVNGVVCTVSKVSNEYWGKTPSGWICLKYCTRI